MDRLDRFGDPVAHGHFADLERHDQG
jgi:hypothetical protein